jgi:hypothetical protein
MTFVSNQINIIIDRKTIITSVLSATLMMSMSTKAQEVRWASADDPVAKELIAKEKMWGESNCSSQPGLKEVFADEFQGTAPDGTRYGKAQAMETDLNNLDRQCQLGEVKIRFFGEIVAVAYGKESGRSSHPRMWLSNANSEVNRFYSLPRSWSRCFTCTDRYTL